MTTATALPTQAPTTTPTPPPAATPSQACAPVRRRFTVEEYFTMAEAGILHQDERVELIDGEIIIMGPMGNPHRQSVNWAEMLLKESIGRRAMVQVQATIVLDDGTAPEPDIAVIRLRSINDLVTVTPEEVYFLVEVADSSLEFDREAKLARYAAAGIPEVWIANLVDTQVEAHDDPVDGVYQNVRVISRGESISPRAFPDVTLAVSDFLPGRNPTP